MATAAQPTPLPAAREARPAMAVEAPVALARSKVLAPAQLLMVSRE
ncbi:hypothetical protein CABS01_07912 [Colletotrichum abscissum]|nr:uncharacterized protein CABS01_07912 [Colletotrichum abscissum]KAK1510240.1 hypothetical protein CABS01_07912 [Colletotrichum abscissum]